MNKKVKELNACGAPEQKTQEFLEGLSSPEVRNLNNEVHQLAANGAERVNHLVEGGASQTLPTESIPQYENAVKEALERDYLEFLYAQSMGSWKSWAYAEHLRKELSLTEEQARAIEEEVYKKFGKTADPSDWNIFLNGTPEQRKALQDAIACEMYGEDPYHEPPDESGDGAATHSNEGPASSQRESEVHEARVSRALDKAGVNGSSGWNPKHWSKL